MKRDSVCDNYVEKVLEIFENSFKTFQYTQRYPLRGALGERERKFLK